MGKAQSAGEQSQIALYPAAVFAIPQQGHPPGGKLHPDLVGAAGIQRDPHQRGLAVAPQSAIGQASLTNALPGTLDGEHLALVAVFEQKIGHFPFFFCGNTRNQSKIFLFQTFFLHRPGQAGGGLGMAGKDHQPRRATVQPVDGEDFSPAPFGKDGQQAFGAFALGQQAGGLQADDDIVVHMDDWNHNASVRDGKPVPYP